MVFIKEIKQKQKIQLEPCNMKLLTTRGPWVSSIGSQVGASI